MPKGKLTLVPTPLYEEGSWDPRIVESLKGILENSPESVLLAVEELKPARRLWTRSGLPREFIEDFIQYNEHTREEKLSHLIGEMKLGKNVFLMSDCGLPAFCDPGADLVRNCHQEGISVTSFPFENSVILALALSGLPHDNFYFAGFLPREKELRIKEAGRHLGEHQTVIFMDTPYRLNALLDDLEKIQKKSKTTRTFFLAMDLNCPNEQLIYGGISHINKKIGKKVKRNFILIAGR